MKKHLVLYCLCIALVYTATAQPGTQKVVTKAAQLIFEPQKLHTHGSTLVNLSNGDILCAWFMGKGERSADDVKIMGARLKKGEKTWSAPFEMADTYNIPDC